MSVVDEVVLAMADLMRLSEPGDRLLSMCVDVVGPEQVLACVRGEVAQSRVVRALHDAGAEVSSADFATAVERWSARVNMLDAARDVRVMGKLGCRLIVRGGSEWAPALDDLGDERPLGVWVRGVGSLKVMASKAIALVGARAPSDYGVSVARSLGFELARDRVAVVSGGAYGIDSAAHEGAMRGASGPATVAFMAGGVDSLYPKGNVDLLRAVADAGLIVSECPPGATAMRHRFLARNRLIAALSGATVVVQAGFRSGAINTAHRAAELGRQVGAVPGRVTDPQSSGCHRLLRDGAAVVVTSTEEVKELVGGLDAVREGDSYAEQAELRITDDLDERELRVFAALPTVRGAGLDSVASKAGVTVNEARSVVGVLMMKGRATKDAHGWKKHGYET